MVEEPPRLLIAALREELAPLIARLEGRRRLGGAGVEGTLDGSPIRLVWTGEGANRAALGMGEALDAPVRGPILVLGVAGALGAGLGVGDLILAREVVANGVSIPPPAAALEIARRWPGVREGVVTSVDRIVADDRARQELAAALPREVPACVDMESATFVRTARERGQECLVVRAISDAVGDELPAYFESCRRADGSIARWRVALAAMGRPGTIPTLLELSRRLSLCAAELGRFARWWLEQQRRLGRDGQGDGRSSRGAESEVAP